jgi:hypothetical protein
VSAEFSARAIDAYGNATTAPSRTILGDSGPPELSWFNYPNDPSTSGRATFEVVQGELPQATWECSLGNTPFEPCTFPITYRGLTVGGHYWRARATDVFGNSNSWPATYLIGDRTLT